MVSTGPRHQAGRNAAGVGGGSADRLHATESWFVRDSDALIASRRRWPTRSRAVRPGLAEITVIPNGIDSKPLAVRPSPRPHRATGTACLLRRLEYEKASTSHRRAAPDPAHPSRTTLPSQETAPSRKWLVEVARKHKCSRLFTCRGVDHDELLRYCTGPMPRCCPVTTNRSASSPWRPRRRIPLSPPNVGGLRGGDRRPDGCLVPPARRHRTGPAVRTVLDDPPRQQARSPPAGG